MTEKTGIMICGHGSRDQGAVDELGALAGHLAQRFPQYEVECGFVEFAAPVIRTGLEKLRDKGVHRIICIPGTLSAAVPEKDNLSNKIDNFAKSNPNLDVRFGRELAIDAKLLKVAQARIEEAEKRAVGAVPRENSLLMVVGRGTNDPDADSNVHKVARMLWEGMGFGWAEVSYADVAYPLVDAGLENAGKLGYRRIIVFPYFLFTDPLVNRIYGWSDDFQATHPDIDIVKASCLNNHADLIDCFADRVQEVLTGDINMNCQLCKYREQIIGHETPADMPQVGHHHHHGHSHRHDHGHEHHHHGNAHDRTGEDSKQ